VLSGLTNRLHFDDSAKLHRESVRIELFQQTIDANRFDIGVTHNLLDLVSCGTERDCAGCPENARRIADQFREKTL
jgi:hypothetical protein